jgi:uncharacterized protein YpmS
MFEGCRACLILIVLIPLACCLLIVCGIVYVMTSAPEPPIADKFTPQESEAQAFETQINNAKYANGYFTVSFNERQISSWLALKSDLLSDQSGERFPLENIQVGLDGGKVTVYAEIKSGSLKFPLEVVITPETDSKGQLSFHIDEAHLGGLSLPKAILNRLTVELDKALKEPFDEVGNYANAQLSVEDGQFIMTAIRQ